MQQTELWSSYMLAKFCQNVGIYKGEKKSHLKFEISKMKSW